MSSIDEIRDTRIKKLKLLTEKGVNPYPALSKRELYLNEAIENFEALEKSKEPKWISGRIMSIRGQGAIIFITLFDGTASFQGLLKKDVLGDEKLNFWNEVTDIGDFVEIFGTFFTTQRGEKTLEATDWRMLSKSLRPLPEKWHGLVDVEERYRKRYLDILMDSELRELIVRKAKFWDVTRNFLKDNGFLEVETPTLETTTGGAEATPFKTHHNDYDLDVFMRISIGELWQKRLMAAGFPKTFEIGRAYRNEGTSPEHAQEFTNMEFYWAYANYNDGMKLVREMYIKIAKEVFGTTKFIYHGHTFDLGGEWEMIDYVSKVKEMTGVDILNDSEEDMKDKLDELGVKYDGDNRERLTDTLWKFCRKQISGPAFLINHPMLVAPLSKINPDNPKTTERFQPIIAGSEVGNGYSELNDPLDQKERFESQQKLLEGGDTEAMMQDDEFVEMLEHGMPPTCGFGFGERLFAILSDKPLRETQIFPLMKPEGSPAKSKKTMMAVAVLNTEAKMQPWQELNTVAHLNAAFGARVGRGDLFTRDTIVTEDNQKIKLNIKNAIMIKTAGSGKELKELLTKAKEKELEVDEFTREMIETTSDKKVVEMTAAKKFDDIEYLGVLVYGPKEVVEELTSGFKLY
ncbi:MAG: lysine--tRNA ligase [Minisyncoccia bacterium]